MRLRIGDRVKIIYTDKDDRIAGFKVGMKGTVSEVFMHAVSVSFDNADNLDDRYGILNQQLLKIKDRNVSNYIKLYEVFDIYSNPTNHNKIFKLGNSIISCDDGRVLLNGEELTLKVNSDDIIKCNVRELIQNN